MTRGTGETGRVGTEVWRQIEPAAGHLDERENRLLRRTAVGIVTVLVLAVGVWWLGLPEPRLTHGNSSAGTTDSARHSGEYEFDLVNESLLPVAVTSIGFDVPGATTTSVEPASPRIAPGSSTHVRMQVRLDDCPAAVHAVRTRAEGRRAPIRVRVARPWGTAQATVPPSGASWVGELVLTACGAEPDS